MTRQDGRWINDAAAIHVTILIVVILQHCKSGPRTDDAAPADDARAEPRTRQQHAATDPEADG
jgi:hypothetical protein